MFSNPRYSTRGISETVPILTQIILWNCIDSMKAEKDYLQVFKLTAKDHTQHVTHSQEEPAYTRSISGLTNQSQQKSSSLMTKHIPPCFWQKNIDLGGSHHGQQRK